MIPSDGDTVRVSDCTAIVIGIYIWVLYIGIYVGNLYLPPGFESLSVLVLNTTVLKACVLGTVGTDYMVLYIGIYPVSLLSAGPGSR